MEIGIITGSGTYALPGFEGGEPEPVRDAVGRGARLARDVRRRARSRTCRATATGHVRLSNHVAHRANIGALAQLGVDAVIAVTVCGAVDPASSSAR